LIGKFFGRNLASIVILGSVVFGFFVPGIGNFVRPYTSYLLMFLMFLTVLSIDPSEIAECARNPRSLVPVILMVFVAGPALALIGLFFFSSSVYAGIVLALCAPSAIATAYFSNLFKGDTAYGLVISMITNLAAILTIPTTMFLAAGAAISLNLASMFLNLAELILVPATVAFLVQRVLRFDFGKVSRTTSKINLAVLFVLIWASISPGSAYALGNLEEFAWLSILMLALLSVLFMVSYGLASGQGHSRAITAGVAASVRNGALALVLGMTSLGVKMILPLVANLVAQSLLLVSLGIVLKNG
jgi:predicted Na+-dependent transporter